MSSGNLDSSIRKHIKKASIPPHYYLPSDSLVNHIISFHKKEATELCRLHNDALVIMIPIANFQVGSIFINNGNFTDILFLTVLKKMDISEPQIQKAITTLVGFNSESTQEVGKIQLPIFIGGENKLTTFLVMDYPSIYNITPGHPWIHSLKAISSTYHQVIYFPTK